jgi:hypothetical protein
MEVRIVAKMSSVMPQQDFNHFPVVKMADLAEAGTVFQITAAHACKTKNGPSIALDLLDESNGACYTTFVGRNEQREQIVEHFKASPKDFIGPVFVDRVTPDDPEKKPFWVFVDFEAPTTGDSAGEQQGEDEIPF